MGRDEGLLIGGNWIQREERIEVRNALSGEMVGTISAGTAGDVKEAIGAAESAVQLDFHRRLRNDKR